MRTYQLPLDLVRERSPERPVALVRPRSVSVAARWFQDNLKADVFYAVKANPSRWVIESLVEAGVTGFWGKYVGLDGAVVGLDSFGASAPAGQLFKHFGITTDKVVEAARVLASRA